MLRLQFVNVCIELLYCLISYYNLKQGGDKNELGNTAKSL